jgi:hypothetical protein
METVKVLRCEADGIRCEVRNVRFRSIRPPKARAGAAESMREGEAFGKKMCPGIVAVEGGWIIVVLMRIPSLEHDTKMNALMGLHSAAGHGCS